MANFADIWEGAQLPSIPPARLIGATIGLVRRHWPAALTAWLALTLLSMVTTEMMRRLPGATSPQMNFGFLSIISSSGLVSSFISAGAMRAFRDQPVLEWSYSFLVCVALLTLASTAPTILSKIALGGPPTNQADPDAVVAFTLKGLGVLIANIITTCVMLRLVLWPVGLATGEVVTPFTSWKLTSRAFASYIGAAVLFCVAPYLAILTLTNSQMRAPDTTPVAPLSAAPLIAFSGLALTVLAVALFELRREGDFAPLQFHQQ